MATCLAALPAAAEELDDLRRQLEQALERIETLERQQSQTTDDVRETQERVNETRKRVQDVELPPPQRADSIDDVRRKRMMTDSRIDIEDRVLSQFLDYEPAVRAPATPVSRVTTQQNYVTGGDFPGSYKLPGTDTSLAIYGFVKGDFVHNFSARRNFPSLLFTSTIPVDGSAGSGRTGDTNFRVNASQINIETRTPTELGELKTHFQFDFFNSDQSAGGGEENSANELIAGLRLAYGKIGNLTIGQDWTAFMNLASYPETADFEGPNAEIFSRVPQIKWSDTLTKGWSYEVGLDNPSGNFETNLTNAAGATIPLADIEDTTFPTLVGNVRTEGDWGHFQLSGQLREIAYDIDTTVGTNSSFAFLNQRSDSAVGWGLAAYLQFLDPIGLHPNDKLTLLGAYGDGIRYIIDTGLLAKGTDGGINPATGELETEEQFAAMAWYQHWWTNTIRSTVVYGLVETDPLPFQPANHFKRSQYLVGNVFWSPWPRVNLGIEGQYGEFKQNNGRNGEAYQIQATGVFLY